jgi:hypothetical protein
MDPNSTEGFIVNVCIQLSSFFAEGDLRPRASNLPEGADMDASGRRSFLTGLLWLLLGSISLLFMGGKWNIVVLTRGMYFLRFRFSSLPRTSS